MRRFEGHQQRETKRDEAVFTESAAVKVRYISLPPSTPSRHNRAIGEPDTAAEKFSFRARVHKRKTARTLPLPPRMCPSTTRSPIQHSHYSAYRVSLTYL